MADEYLRSYGDTNIVQDISKLIEILTATEVWFMNNLGKTTAVATTHVSQDDVLDAVASLAVEEGTDSTLKALVTPISRSNIVEHVAYPFAVSDVQRAVNHYSGSDELTRQTEKAVRNLANGFEFDLLRSTLVSGVSGSTPKMKGVLQAISLAKNTTAHNSGTVFSASVLNGLMRQSYTQSNGEVPTDLFLGPWLRFKMDEFTTKTNVLVQSPQNTIDQMVDVYKTSFANLFVHNHRYLTISGTDATARLLAVRPEKLKIAYLQAPRIVPLSRTGLSEKRVATLDGTLEVRNQESHFWSSGFDLD